MEKKILIIFCFVYLGSALPRSRYNEINSRTSPSVQEDINLTTPELVKKNGYPSETHKIRTEDGYILDVHRIPRRGGTPIFLMHGLFVSSAIWVINGPEQSLAYYLYDLGYDVWLGNTRGNRYARKHISLSPDTKDFWEFSFHEIGEKDIPAMMDYILKKTGHKKLHYIGHSQGTIAFFVMCDLRPKYCDKVQSMNALAPIAYLTNIQSPFLLRIAPLISTIDVIVGLAGVYEYSNDNQLYKWAINNLCGDRSSSLCTNTLFLIAGEDSQEFNQTMLPVYLGHFPAGGSIKQIIHYGQLATTSDFRQYDYGFFQNLYKYKQTEPPSYDLSKTTAPVALHYSLNDLLAHVTDVNRLANELPNVVGRYKIPNPAFNHLDFVIAIHSRDIVYHNVVKVIRSFDHK